MRFKAGTTIICLLFVLSQDFHGMAIPGDDFFERWIEYAETGKGALLTAWLRGQAWKELGHERAADQSMESAAGDAPPFYGRLGLFITLIKKGKVRGCYGAFHHSSDRLESVLKEYLKGALRYDPRHIPLGIEELKETVIVVTVASMPLQAEGLGSVDITNYGVMITYESGESALFVPAEMKTHSYLERSMDKKVIMNISMFRAVTIQEAGEKPGIKPR